MDRLYKLPPNNKLILALCLTGLAAIGVTLIYSLNPTATEEEIETVKPQPVNYVTALGRIEPQGKLIQLAPTPDLGGAKVARLLVAEGDRLSRGQIVARLDNYQRTSAAVELARQEVEVARADLAIVKAGAKRGDIQAQQAVVKRLQAELAEETAANRAEIARLQAQLRTETLEKQAASDRLKAELNNARSEFERYQQLARDGVISDSELDSRRLAVATAEQALAEARASYNRVQTTIQEQIKQAQAVFRQNKATLREQITAAKATLNSLSEVREVDIAKARAEVNRAIAALHQAEEDRELTVVKAPSDGQVIKINSYPGELVGEDGIIEFADTTNMMVVAEVYESDIGRVIIDQTASITSETGAFEGEISGIVRRVGMKVGKQDVLDTDPAADVDSRVVEVEIHLDSQTSDRVAHLTNSKTMVRINK